jgi:uncharacterized membrane protein YheB (UPF0754 family)
LPPVALIYNFRVVGNSACIFLLCGGFMKTVKVPITKSLSVQPDDIIGTLEIDEVVADQIAALSAAKLEMRLETSIQKKDGKWVLHLVSFGSVPVEPAVAT